MRPIGQINIHCILSGSEKKTTKNFNPNLRGGSRGFIFGTITFEITYVQYFVLLRNNTRQHQMGVFIPELNLEIPIVVFLYLKVKIKSTV